MLVYVGEKRLTATDQKRVRGNRISSSTHPECDKMADG